MNIPQVSAQPKSDLAILLQKIVDLSELQQYYPLNPSNSYKPLVILQHGVSFPSNISVTHNSNPLTFKSKQEIISETAYFLFWTFDISEDEAKVEFSYHNKVGSPTQSAQKAEVYFNKLNNIWTLTTFNIQTIQK